MDSPNYFRITILTLLFLAVISMAFKARPISKHLDDFYAEKVYKVTYRYFYKTNDGKTMVKTFLPKNNSRQRISTETFEANNTAITFERKSAGNNINGIWTSRRKQHYESIDYEFVFEGKSKKATLPENFNIVGDQYVDFLKPSEFIQSNDPFIDSIAKNTTVNAKYDRQKIQLIFDFVYRIPSAPIITLTDAVTAVKQNRASCNGKSRLFIALARNLGYPARIRGGVILEEINKRTSHIWAEVNINDQWVPFDPLNNHFAFLPANYLELYEGDEFLLTHTPNISFDYTYEIKKQNHIPFLKVSSDNFSEILPISLFGLVENKIISKNALLLLLMLPVGGLLVAFLRNVIGLKTFGVFLPVLIAFSLLETGFGVGMLLFVFLVLFVGMISRPFHKLGLLHTPKLVISLSLMVLVMILGSYLGLKKNIVWLTSLTFFPTIILTISAERFSTLIVENGFQKASGILFQTLIAVSVCYFMLSSEWLSSIVLLFPEFLLMIVVLAMLLGRYTGLRWTELFRFKPLLTVKTI